MLCLSSKTATYQNSQGEDFSHREIDWDLM
jgi:hypothetical protein